MRSNFLTATEIHRGSWWGDAARCGADPPDLQPPCVGRPQVIHHWLNIIVRGGGERLSSHKFWSQKVKILIISTPQVPYIVCIKPHLLFPVCVSVTTYMALLLCYSATFFVTFWSMSMYDLAVPTTVYDKQIQQLTSQIAAIEDNEDLVGVTSMTKGHSW